MADSISVHNAHAANYESERRRLIPPYDLFYGSALEALDLAGRRIGRVLDLGAGTGLLSRLVADRFPKADLTLVDGAPAMLERARKLLGSREANLLVADLGDPLPPGPWDAVVSALAIHHLNDAGKRALFAEIYAELAPGGVLVNAEQVAAPTALFQDRYTDWHERQARAAGSTSTEWAKATERMRFDRWASVEHQLEWLRNAGFADADCMFKHYSFAVIVARRSG